MRRPREGGREVLDEVVAHGLARGQEAVPQNAEYEVRDGGRSRTGRQVAPCPGPIEEHLERVAPTLQKRAAEEFTELLVDLGLRHQDAQDVGDALLAAEPERVPEESPYIVGIGAVVGVRDVQVGFHREGFEENVGLGGPPAVDRLFAASGAAGDSFDRQARVADLADQFERGDQDRHPALLAALASRA